MPKPKQIKSSNRKKKPVVPQQGFFSQFVGAVLIIIALVGITSLFVDGDGAAKQEDVAISVIANDIAAGSVTALAVEGDKVIATYAEGVEKVARKEENSSLQEVMSAYGVTPEALRAVPTTVKDQSGMQILLFTVLPLLLPLIIIVALIWFFSRQMKGAGMQALTFVQSKARIVDPNDKKTRVMFKDVAGAKEAKQELLEIVDFLKNPKKFLDIGAKIPKGVLLMGAPGTGKTLLARAVAGEAGVPFFSISGSEFVEMFVGVGASRVRDLFKVAKAASPSIVFIDEIDAVGRVRGSGSGGSNDEREQTLNQILVEMDGFDPTEKVIVMAATNRPDVLDPALLRPGRFDRRVVVDLPDREDREAILNVHALEKPLAEDVVLGVIAERTPGFSGADLASLMNEAAILAAREDRKKVAQYDLIRSIEKVMLGPERQSHLLNAKEKEITAYHEAGHALIASVLPYADPVHKISVISRGRAAGYTLKLPIEDKKMQSKKEFLDDIAVSLGGYTAERLIFGDITTGPSNDIQVLTALARDMVTRYGMSDVIGPIALEGNEGRALFGRGVYGDEHSQKVSEDIDREVKKIITDAEEKAVNILNDHRPLLDAIAKRLMEAETIERDDFEVMLIAHGIQPKKKQDIEHIV